MTYVADDSVSYMYPAGVASLERLPDGRWKKNLDVRHTTHWDGVREENYFVTTVTYKDFASRQVYFKAKDRRVLKASDLFKAVEGMQWCESGILITTDPRNVYLLVATQLGLPHERDLPVKSITDYASAVGYVDPLVCEDI